MIDSLIRFAIFNDTHIGFQETNAINGSDSFEVFQEALQISKFEKADAVLHAGDLFDCKSPSNMSHSRAIEIMWEHCAGEPERDQIKIPYSKGLSLSPNTASDNINISLPFFVIHGNHDSPSGKSFSTPCDLLSNSRIVNYFKVASSFSSIELYPVVIRRNQLDVIIYGLGNITKKAFFDNLSDNLIDFRKPDIELKKKTFTILLLHQDKISHSRKVENLQEKIIEKYPFFDLVICGHEHKHYKFDMSKTKIVQLGSTIVTNFSKKYATDHFMMIFEVFLSQKLYNSDINGTNQNNIINDDGIEIQCQYREIPLRKSRPLIYKLLKLQNEFGRDKDFYLNQIRETIKNMISGTDWEKPFIRVCIQKSPDLFDPHKLNLHQIEYEFEKLVGNPRTITKIKLEKNKIKTINKGKNNSGVGEQPNEIDHVNFDEMIDEHVINENFDFLTPDIFRQSMSEFTGNDKKDAFMVNINAFIQNSVNFLVEKASKSFPEKHQMSELEWDDFYSKARPEFLGIDQFTNNNNSNANNINTKNNNTNNTNNNNTNTNYDNTNYGNTNNNNTNNNNTNNNNTNNNSANNNSANNNYCKKLKNEIENNDIYSINVNINHNKIINIASDEDGESDPDMRFGPNHTTDVFNEYKVKTKRKILKVKPQNRAKKVKMNTLTLSFAQV